jgi:hypothetical protein
VPKPLTTRQLTANTTTRIADHQFVEGTLGQRTNTLPVPVVRNGVQVGFRPGSRSGRPDYEGIYPIIRTGLGVPVLIEVKTGRDKLRDIQVSYLSQAAAIGAVVLVVKDFEDYLEKWANVRLILKLIFDGKRVSKSS